jgi:serine/threonine protein kinase
MESSTKTGQILLVDGSQDTFQTKSLPIGRCLRSKTFQATMRIAGQEGTEAVTLKRFNPAALFTSNDVRVVDENLTDEERTALIPLEQQEQVHQRFTEALQFFQQPAFQHDSLLKMKAFAAPRENVTKFAVAYEEFDGVSLEKLLSNDEVARLQLSSLPLLTKIQRLVDVASAIEQLHDGDILHRNLHSANILFSQDFQTVKVSDYALDAFLVRVPKVKQEGEGEDEEEEDSEVESKEDTQALLAVTGMPAKYSPPELLSGGCFVEKSDAYCFGMIAWQLLSGDQFETSFADDQKLIEQIVKKNYRPDLKALESELPVEVRGEILNLLEECWDKKLDKRPDFSDISEKLDQIKTKLE